MKTKGCIRSVFMGMMVTCLLSLVMACGGGGDGGGAPGSSASINLDVDPATIPADGSSASKITATVTDSNGNPVRHYTDVTFSTTLGRFRNGGTSYTVQTQPPLDEDGKPDTDADPTGIAEVALIAGLTGGTAKVSASSNGVSQSVYVNISGDVIAIQLTAVPETIPADGQSSSEITATLTDATGESIPAGTEVTFETSLGHFSNGQKTITKTTPEVSGGRSQVSVSVIAGVVPGSTYVQATSNDVSQAVVLTFTDTFLSKLSIEADPTYIEADGESTSLVKATVKHVDATPIENVPVTFYDGSGSTEPIPLPPDNTYTGTGQKVTPKFYSYGGVTTFTMTYTGSEISNFAVWLWNADTEERESLLANEIGPLTEYQKVESLSSGNHFLEVLADGGWQIKVEGSIGPGEPGETEVLAIGNTDSSGNAKYVYTSTFVPGEVKIKAETGQVSSSLEALSETVTITQTEGPPPLITVTAGDSSLYANGEKKTTIQAEVLTKKGNPVPDGTVVTFSATRGTLDNTTAATVNGKASTILIASSSSTSITSTVTATVGSDSGSTTVDFIGVTLSDMQADPATIFSDGSDTSTISVRLKNDSGIAIEGENVNFSTTMGTLSPSSATTDANGIATVTLIAPTSTGTATISAAYGLITATTQVTFTDEPTVGNIVLEADPTTIPADGSSASKITATVTKGDGNPVGKGTSVTFTTDLGSFSNGSQTYTVVTPDATGAVTVSLIAGTTTGSAQVTASSGGVSQSIYVGIGGTPISIELEADPTSISADGSSSSTITATLTDGSGSAVTPGTSVTFSTTLGTFSNGSTSITTATQDDTGIVAVSLIAGTTSGTATVTCSSSGVSQSTTVTFTGGGGTPTSLSISVSKTSVKSDNSESSTVTATVLDANNAVVEGVTISFSASGGQLSASSGETDANGQAKVTFSSGTTDRSNQTVTITASVSGLSPETIPIQIVGSTLTLSTNNTTITDDGSTTATLTITAQDAGGTAVYNTAITLTVSGAGDATVSPSSGNTNVSGQLTVTVTGTSAGSITVTASGLGTTAAQNYTVSSVGTAFGIVLPTTDPLSKYTQNVASLATTGDNTTIAFVDSNPDTITRSDGNPFVAEGYAADDVIMVGGSDSNDGVYTIDTVAAGKLTLVSTDSLTAEAAGESVTITNGVLVRVRAPSQTNVVFAATIGTWRNTGSSIDTRAVASGYVWNVLTSDEVGAATVQVYDDDDSTTSDKTTVAFAAPSGDASQIALQSNTYVVAPSTGDVVNTATLTATVKTASDQVVKDAAVAFSIQDTTGGGETVSPVVVLTDTAGKAQSTFTSGSQSSGAEGVKINAEIVGTAISATIRIVIGGTAGSVVIGRGTEVTKLDPATYSLPMSVLVADSNGNPVSGAEVSLSAWPLQYSSGVWYDEDNNPDDPYYLPYITGTFDNEDVNENLILDPGEDTNGDGELTPPSSAAGDVPDSVTTDENGVANFNLVYLKSSAAWIVDRIKASTLVLGTETTSSLNFRLPYERVEGHGGELPDSGYPIGLVNGVAPATVSYTFPTFGDTGNDAFSPMASLSAGSSSVAGHVYTYDSSGGTAPVVGDEVWDYITATGTNGAINISAYFPVRIIIE